MNSGAKVVVIGLDGATWSLLGPWTAGGQLPALQGLMQTGIYADLLSTLPYYTLPAWTTMTTGVNPGKHGIFDTFINERDGRRLVSSKDRKAKTLFQILSENGKTSVSVNIPGTFPPDKINGAAVSGVMTTSFFNNLV